MKGWSDFPVSTSIPCVLEYLMHLKNQEFSNSLLKVHLTAIFMYHMLVDGRWLFDNYSVKTFMERLPNVYPPVKDPVPLWDLDLVLAWLVKSPFEPLTECSFCHLSIKMAFISARKVNKLNYPIADPPFTSFRMDNVVFRHDPKFLSTSIRSLICRFSFLSCILMGGISCRYFEC